MKNHGCDGQAVHACGREEPDGWEQELGCPLSKGVFGEYLTAAGVPVSDALVGER